MTLRTISLAASVASGTVAVLSLITFFVRYPEYGPYYQSHPFELAVFAAGIGKELIVAAAFLTIHLQTRKAGAGSDGG